MRVECTWISGWDIAGRRTQLTWPDGFYVNYDYDTLNEMTAVRENGATSGVGVLASFTYDDLGRRTGLARGNGVNTNYGYDAISRLATLMQDLGGTANDQTYTFGYNAASQIAGQTTTNNTYDWNGSLLNTGYGVNGLNQVTSIGATVLSHDARGNLTNDGTKTYGFDAENRLTSASGSPGATLSYDPAGRLYETTGAMTTRFAYDGANMVGEYSSSNVLLRRYVYGPGTDEPLVWYEGGSASTDRRWMMADPRRSVIAVTDGTGAATQIDRYDDYGRPGATNTVRFQYTGQMWLAEAGVYHYKARAYHPGLGRFLQTDPMGYPAGMNLYAYAGNDPVNSVDPTGLCVGQGVDPDGLEYVCVPNGGEGVDWAFWSTGNGAWQDPTGVGLANAVAGSGGGWPKIEERTPQGDQGKCWNGEQGNMGNLVGGMGRQLGNDAYDAGRLLNPIGGLIQSILYGDDVFGSDDTNMGILGADLAPAVEVLAGGLLGAEAAGTRGAGMEFSHWIPARMGGPRGILNGNFVTTRVHALSDPFRYRFMPRSWKAGNPMPSVVNQQLTRIPNVLKGAAAGAAGAAKGGC